jgi:hypothetical protein
VSRSSDLSSTRSSSTGSSMYPVLANRYPQWKAATRSAEIRSRASSGLAI